MVTPRTHTQRVDISGVALVSGQIPTTAAGGGGVASDVSVAHVAVVSGQFKTTAAGGGGVASDVSVAGVAISGNKLHVDLPGVNTSGGKVLTTAAGGGDAVSIVDVSGDIRVTAGDAPVPVTINSTPLAVSAAGGSIGVSAKGGQVSVASVAISGNKLHVDLPGVNTSGGKISTTAAGEPNVAVTDISGDVRVTAGDALLPVLASVSGDVHVTAGASPIPVTVAGQPVAVSVQNEIGVSGTVAISNDPINVSAAGGSIGVSVKAGQVSVAGVGISSNRLAVDLPGVAIVSGRVATTAAGNPIQAVSAAAATWPISYEAGKVFTSGHMTSIGDAAITVGASAGNYELVGAVSGQAIRVLDYSLVTPGTVQVFFRSSTGGAALTGGLELARGVAPGFNPMGYFQTESSHALTIQTDAAVSVGGSLTWIGV